MATKRIFNIIMVMFLLVGAGVVTSCDKYEDMYDLDIKPTNNGDDNNSEKEVTVIRDSENGTAVVKEVINGVERDTTVVVALGAVNFSITPLDTVAVAIPEVLSESFEETTDKDNNTEYWEENGVFYTKTTKTYTHTLNCYKKEITIDYLDAYTYVWGKRVEFPAAKGAVSLETGSIVVADEGIKDKLHFYLSTSMYKVAFMEGSSVEKGFERLVIDADDTLLSTERTDEGYETLTSTTAKSWIEVTRTYKLSGESVTRYEVILNNGINSPAYAQLTLGSFTLSQISAVLGTAIVSGNREEGNISITGYSQNYVVGNDKFTKTFVFSYEKATWSDGTDSFEMPYRAYENVNDNGFTMNEMNPANGHDRQLNVHSISASFNGNSASAKAETEIRVVQVNDELVSREVVEEGFDYVNPTTSKTWIKIREIWSVSGEKTYVKEINLTNSIVAPASITRILPDFKLNQIDANTGTELLIASNNVGDFLVQDFEVRFTVGNNAFTRVVSFRYQKAKYAPMNHQMQWKGYESISDNGFNMTDMSKTSKNGLDYNRKAYAHKVSATFNGRNAEANAPAELWVEIEYPRETPNWMGKPVSAKYTRVQQATGQKFMDMIYFEYENGCVLAPNGVVDMKLTYAFDPAIAAAEGVEATQRGVYSAVYANGKWFPASITMTQGRWIYAGANHNGGTWSHTVHQNNAVTLGIGVDVTPIPSAQSFQIEGNKITIKYAVNNGSTTANTSLSVR